MTRPRVAVAALFHETNVFASSPTTEVEFRHRWYVGQELLDAQRGTRTVIGGFCAGADDYGFELVPVCAIFATPSGVVTREAFDAALVALRVGLVAAGKVDGILLELHGDLVAEGVGDAEEAVVDVVREVFPSVPLAIVLDFHANMSVPRLKRADIVVGYRQNPHVDTCDRGREAAALLASVIEGRLRPHRAHRGLPVIAAPAAQMTASEPMNSLNALADELRGQPAIVNVSIHAGYAYSDRVYTGMGFSVTADSSDVLVAEVAADRLLECAMGLWPMFRALFPSAQESLDDAARGPGLVAVADTGDNINGGSSGDTTWLLHEAVLYPDLRFLGTVADPLALAQIEAAGEGATLDLSLGGRASARSGEPFRGSALVLALSDGVFRNTGPMAFGARVSMGGAAWVRIGNCDILVQRFATQPNDSNLFMHLGIDPGSYHVLLLKGAAALRAAWSDVVDRFIDAGTEGETDSILARLPCQKRDLLNFSPKDRHEY